MAEYSGHEITVQLAPGERAKVGDALIFYTNGWVFGESVAVQSVGHEPATASRAAALGSHPDDPVRSLRTREALSQTAAASLVVSGRVTAVREATTEKVVRGRAAMASAGPSREPISEHSPRWQEAVIDIDEVHKGSHAKKQVVVRFPSSTDVRWHKAPKFHAGQEGVFLLHQQPAAGRAGRVRAAAAAPSGEFTALHPADVQPLEELPRIKLAVGSGATVRRVTSRRSVTATKTLARVRARRASTSKRRRPKAR
jgi:hypothetical protein